MIEDLEQLIGVSVKEVFGTMLNLEVQRDPSDTMDTNGEPHVASSVGFIGRLSGVVYLYCTSSFACQITSRLLGLSEAETEGDEMVNDAMGELANMVVGQLKSRLSDRGMHCALTIPSIVRGSQFRIEPVSTIERRIFCFRCNSNQLLLEVLIKPVNET